MENIKKNVTELIGNTPLMEAANYSNAKGLKARLLLKLEFFNPGGSIKDRVALNMIETAERAGKLKPGATIIESTSGNTGIGLAVVAASKGYKTILTMPETMSVERRKLLSAYGAEIVLTPGEAGMSGAVEKAEELAANIPGSLLAEQFANPANPEAHYISTGPEIWEGCGGEIDILVAGIGTGGTITGTGKYLKEKNPDLKIIGVEPADSPLLSAGKAAPHPIQGIGANFIPKTLDMCIYDEIILASGADAMRAMRDIAKYEGIFVGISSGAALWAAEQAAGRNENGGKRIRIVAILPDTGERYLSVL